MDANVAYQFQRCCQSESFRHTIEWVAGKHHLLPAVRFSLESGQKQRASRELAPAGCLFACKRLDSGGGRRRTELSYKRCVRVAVSPF